MFVWLEKSGQRGHLQIIENKRDGFAVRQRVIANLGRRRIGASGALAPLIAAGAKLTDQVLLLVTSAAHKRARRGRRRRAVDCGELNRRADAFVQIRERLGIGAVLDEWLTDREFEFALMESEGCFCHSLA